MNAHRIVLVSALVLAACEEAARPPPDATATSVPVASPIPTAAATSTLAQVEPIEPTTPQPDWVNKGSSFTDESGARFGVGMAKGIGNSSLARSTAGNRARAEIGKAVATNTQVVEAEGGTKVRTFSVTLSGVEIVEYWTDPKTGAVYALARQATTPP